MDGPLFPTPPLVLRGFAGAPKRQGGPRDAAETPPGKSSVLKRDSSATQASGGVGQASRCGSPRPPRMEESSSRCGPWTGRRVTRSKFPALSQTSRTRNFGEGPATCVNQAFRGIGIHAQV